MAGHNLWRHWAEGDQPSSAYFPGKNAERSAVLQGAWPTLHFVFQMLRVPTIFIHAKAAGHSCSVVNKLLCAGCCA